MKITEYARTQGRWQLVRDYYWFVSHHLPDDNLRPPRDPCPGCGRLFSAPSLRAHECLGGTAGYPRLPNARRLAVLQADPDRLREYLASRDHHTVSTNG